MRKKYKAAALRTTLDGQFSPATGQTRRTFSSANLAFERRIVFNSYLRDHQVVFAYTGMAVQRSRCPEM